jgi:hypothetical protein
MSRNHKIKNQSQAFVMGALALTVVSACIASPSEDDALDQVADAATSGKTVIVKDNEHFCLFLPKHGQAVGKSETNAKPSCTVRGLAPGANTLPSGAVSAHEVKNANFIQITGRLDVQKLGLISSDSGGQYDNYTSPSTPHGSPSGASCQGYKYFVEQVEPDAHRYCIRCCDEVSKNLGDAHRACIENHSSAGCDAIMPGADFD